MNKTRTRMRQVRVILMAGFIVIALCREAPVFAAPQAERKLAVHSISGRPDRYVLPEGLSKNKVMCLKRVRRIVAGRIIAVKKKVYWSSYKYLREAARGRSSGLRLRRTLKSLSREAKRALQMCRFPPVGYQTCLDGLDNDADGAKDISDFDCAGPNQTEAAYTGSNYGTDSDGWTRMQPSPDTRIYYVSSGGDDNNDGLSPGSPFRTLAKAAQSIRNGSADWILLKRGEVFLEGINLKRTGRSATERLLISSYGESPHRPVLKTGPANGITIIGGGGAPAEVGNLAIVGLHLYAHTRDPSSPDFSGTGGGTGILYLRPGSNFLIEDCRIEFYRGNLTIQAEGAGLFNFSMRRNLVLDSYSVDSHSQGIYTERNHGVLFEGNLFDHNGWAQDGPAGSEGTIFNHNMYIQGNGSGPQGSTGVAVRDNIIARGASHGLQLRPGGVVERNLFLRNSLAMFVGEGDNAVRGNVVLDAKDINSTTPRGHGIAVINDSVSAVVENNIVANKRSSAAPWYEAFHLGGGSAAAQNFTFKNNIAWNWNGTSLLIDATEGDIMAISGNMLQETGFEQTLVRYDGPVPNSALTVSSNLYFSKIRLNWWFHCGSDLCPFSTWQEQFGDAGSQAGEAAFVDPARTVETWQASIGGEPSLEAFLSEARAQGKTNWRTNFAPAPIIAYVQEGFTRQ